MGGQAQTKLPNVEKVEQALEYLREFSKALDMLDGLNVEFAKTALYEASGDSYVDEALTKITIIQYLIDHAPSIVDEFLENLSELVNDAIEDLNLILKRVEAIEQEGGDGG
jgi:hypothetical protein